jgi:hypothetical protein
MVSKGVTAHGIKACKRIPASVEVKEVVGASQLPLKTKLVLMWKHNGREMGWFGWKYLSGFTSRKVYLVGLVA